MPRACPDAGAGRSAQEPRAARNTTTPSSYAPSADSSSTYGHSDDISAQPRIACHRVELWLHAVRMSKSAKAAENPQSRRRFYAEKCWAVSRAIVLGAARADAYEINTGLLSVSFMNGGRLHVPVHGLSPDARCAVRTRLLSRLEPLAP